MLNQKNKEMYRDYDLFDKVLDVLTDGLKVVFTPKNVAVGDNFLIFSSRKKQTITFKLWGGLWYVCFEGGWDEPMLLEDCPDSFYRSILKNVK